MKNLEKKIVCVISLLFLFCCGIASFWTYLKDKDIASALRANHPFTNFFYSIYGTTNKVMDKSFVKDNESGVYKLKNGYLSYQKSPFNPEIYEENLVEFNEYLEGKGIDFTYVLTAEAGDERLGQLPFGVETNYCEETNNKLLGVLKRNNIEYLDTFEVLTNADKDYYAYFYKTDHHWNDYAGLLVSQAIANHFNEDYGMNLDPSIFDEEQYDRIVYERAFLGSCGKKVCKGYVEPEDFELLLPKFPTKLSCNYKDLTPGTYFETLIDSKVFINSHYGTSYYSAYMFGDKPTLSVKNFNCNNGKRVLVLKDSKANVVNTHLATCVEYLDIVDLRHFSRGKLRNFIEETNPDVVITIYSAFNTGVFYDFR